MAKHILFDLETMSTKVDGVILSLGILAFDDEVEYNIEELFSRTRHFKFDAVDQIKNYGRTISESTKNWWLSRGEEARWILKPSPTDIKISELPKLFSDFYSEFNIKPKYTVHWSRGIYIDWGILLSVFEDSLGVDTPFPYWSNRDTRTFIDTVLEIKTGKVPAGAEGVKFYEHDASHDVILDYIRIKRCMQVQKGDPRVNSLDDFKLKLGDKL